MLGRYVAGTLLVLGVAMVMAPPAPETRDNGVEATRAESAPSTLAAPPRAVPDTAEAANAPAAAEPAGGVLAPVVASAPASDVGAAPGSNAALEAAVLEALRLDQSEQAGRPPRPAEPEAQDAPEIALAEDSPDAGQRPEAGVLAGLGDPGFLAVPTADPRQAEDARTMIVTGSRVNLRSGPSTGYSVVGTVEEGDQVELVTFADEDWAHVRLFDGEEGYLSRNFLSVE